MGDEVRLQLRRQDVDRTAHDRLVRFESPGERRRGRQKNDDHSGRRAASKHAGILPTAMDNLTHTLFGLTLARTPLGRAGRGVTTALVLASNAPDVDIVLTAGRNLSYMQWHRGPTHGAIGVVALGLLVAFLVRIGQRIADRYEMRRPGVDHEAEAPLGMLVARH